MLMNRSGFTLRCQVLFYCRLVELIRLTLLYGDGVHGTFTQAGAKTVTQVVRRQHRFSVDDGDGPLGTGWYAVSAAVTFIRVYFYDLSQHGCFSFYYFLWIDSVQIVTVR
jgi:hypothetical protein